MKTLLIVFAMIAGTLGASAVEHDNAPAKAVSQGQALILTGKQLVISTTDGTTFHYLVSSYDTPMIHRLQGSIVVEGDTFMLSKVKALRFQSMPHYLLDEDSTSYSGKYAVNHGLLAFRKTLNTNKWNSLCVPFSMTGKQVRKCFGDDARLAKVSKMREGEEAAIELQSIDLNTNGDAIAAGSHYIIMPTREPDFDSSKRISTGWNATRAYGPIYMLPLTSMETKQKPSPQNLWSADRSLHVYITGTFNRLDDSERSTSYILNKRVAPGCYFFNNEGLVEQHTDSTAVNGFVSWFQDLSKMTTTFHFYLDGVDDDMLDTSGISALIARKPKADDSVYDLRGRRVASAAQLSSLRKGIYIVNGRKQIVK